MQMLLFQVDSHSLGIDYGKIAEVVPLVQFRKANGLPEYVAGFFNYRGKSIAAIDMSRLIANRNFKKIYGTRIVVLENLMPDKSLRHIGLITEKVSRAIELGDSELESMMPSNLDIPCLGEIYVSGGQKISRVNIGSLLSDDLCDILFNRPL